MAFDQEVIDSRAIEIFERFKKYGGLKSPCGIPQIQIAEAKIGRKLPLLLRSMYLISDGMTGPLSCPYLFSLEHLIEMTLYWSQDYSRDGDVLSPNFDCFVFFGGLIGSWNLAYSNKDEIIAYHHHMDDKYLPLELDLLDVYLNDERDASHYAEIWDNLPD